MDRRHIACIGVAAAALAIGAGASAQTKKPAPAAAKPAAAKAAAPVQRVTGPKVVYWMDATTEAGFSASAPSGGGMAAAMQMMRGMASGNSGRHKLFLRLATNEGPGIPATTATHQAPPTLGGENPLKLGYTAPTQGKPVPEAPSEPPKVERPKGKILLYSGCGPHVAAGQPIVIDLSKITDPAMIATLTAALEPKLGLQNVIPPLPSNYKSYADGPRSNKVIEFPLTSSMLGDHAVKSNAASDINFNLAPGQDFLPAFNLTASSAAADGSIPLTWALALNVRAIAITAVGARGDGSIVMWANSAAAVGWISRANGFLTAADIAKLTADNTLLRGSTTSCTIPAEVFGATPGGGGGGGMISMYGYAPDTDIAYPPRPADPKVDWNIEWTTKVRYRTQYTTILGMGAMTGGNDPSIVGQTAPGRPARPSVPGMGGLLGRAIGGALGQ